MALAIMRCLQPFGKGKPPSGSSLHNSLKSWPQSFWEGSSCALKSLGWAGNSMPSTVSSVDDMMSIWPVSMRTISNVIDPCDSAYLRPVSLLAAAVSKVNITGDARFHSSVVVYRPVSVSRCACRNCTEPISAKRPSRSQHNFNFSCLVPKISAFVAARFVTSQWAPKEFIPTSLGANVKVGASGHAKPCRSKSFGSPLPLGTTRLPSRAPMESSASDVGDAADATAATSEPDSGTLYHRTSSTWSQPGARSPAKVAPSATRPPHVRGSVTFVSWMPVRVYARIPLM
mmetsp:Transcript_44291/g.134239  ORF Transcript_44291/g.134239 Transcript_44291/m.134239 type:complete len:287 (-) Transcript_44291:268-1128(-)